MRTLTVAELLRRVAHSVDSALDAVADRARSVFDRFLFIARMRRESDSGSIPSSDRKSHLEKLEQFDRRLRKRHGGHAERLDFEERLASDKDQF